MDPGPRKKSDWPMGSPVIPFRRSALLMALLGAAFLSGCAEVKPWERDVLSRPSMQLDSTPTMTAADDHIYFSREASKGGRNYAGGGCGCN